MYKVIKSYKITALCLFSLLLTSCEARLQKKQNEGYQVFFEYGIGIKVPCQLIPDSTVTYPSDLGVMKAFVCPQIFTDTSRTSFKIEPLLSGSPIYHLQIWENKEIKDIGQALNEQLKVMYELNTEVIEDIKVDGKHALLYGPLKTYTWQAFIPTEQNTIYVGVTDANGKEELEKILENMIIEE